MSISAGVVRAIALQQIDHAPHAKASAEGDHKGLQSGDGRSEKLHMLSDALSKAMWVRQRGYRAVPNQGQPHPGEIVLLLLLREKSQNRKVLNCKLFVNV